MRGFSVVVLLSVLSLQALVLLCYLPKAQSQLSSSESRVLFQIQQKLDHPESLKEWNKNTNFCNLSPTSSVSVVCSNNHITELSITGNKNPTTTTTLPKDFSIESFFTDVTKLTALRKLSLVSLGIWGPLPLKIERLSSLQVLNLSTNSISGEIPLSISSMTSLRSLILSKNLMTGDVPDLTKLRSLQELDLGYNQINSTEFPSVSSSLITLVLRNNSMRSEIPSELKMFNHLQRFDVSFNHLAGPVQSFLFSLPELRYLNLAGNHLTGAIPKSTTCGDKLSVMDISSNLLTGTLPSCIVSASKHKKVFVAWNCLSGIKYQHKTSFCQRQALAVQPTLKPKTSKEQERMSGIRRAIVLALVAGIVFAFSVIVGLLVCAICKKRGSSVCGASKPISTLAKSPALPTPPSIVSKYVPTTSRMPALGLPSFHAFTLQDLEDATNNFDTENFIAEKPGSQEKLYKGLLRNGSAVLISSIKLRQKHSLKSLKQHMEVIDQLRNQNLASVIGHCIVTYHQDKTNSKGNTIFVVFEHVSNGSLREHLRDWRRKEVLKWPQRMTISMGIARGVHFLHGGMAPGVFGNNLNIDNILLDETLTPKVSGYRIPLPPKEGVDSHSDAEKDDIYQLGAILLEILTGKQITSPDHLDELKQELERSMTEPASAMHQAVDPLLRGTFAQQSLKTAMEITISCLSKEPNRRPSMEDVLWNLQYSIQAQQAWTTSGNLGLNSGNIGLHLLK